MQGPFDKLPALLIACCLAVTSGCAATMEGIGDLFARKKETDKDLGIKTPLDRTKELHELTKTAKKKSPEEQDRITAQLAKEIQHENDPIMRRQILRTLAAYPTPLATSLIVAGLSDSDAETRRLACMCLGQRGGKEAVIELTRVLTSDTNADVRIVAVRALGLTKDSAALVALAEALADPDPAMQNRAVESLTAISGRHYGNNLEAWRQFAKTGKSDEPEISLVERMRRAIY